MKQVVGILLGLVALSALAQTTAFGPIYNTPTVLSATTTSSNATLANSLNQDQVRVYNSCPVLAYIKFHNNSGVTATSADIPMAPNSVEVFSVSSSYTWAAVILLSGGPCNVSFLRGAGL